MFAVVLDGVLDQRRVPPIAQGRLDTALNRQMTGAIMGMAGDVCEARMVVCLEGGYSPGYMPYCCLAVVETLAGVRTEVEDVRGVHLAGVAGQALQPHQADVIASAAYTKDQ